MILVALNAPHSDGTYIRYDPLKYGYDSLAHNIHTIPKIMAVHGGSHGCAVLKIDPHYYGFILDSFYKWSPKRTQGIQSSRAKMTRDSVGVTVPEHENRDYMEFLC